MDRRLLLVSQVPIWPVTHGAQLRLALVYEALSKLGKVEVAAISSASRRGDVSEGPPHYTILEGPTRHELNRIRWLLDRSKRPISLFVRDASKTRSQMQKLTNNTSYDLAWFSRLTTYHWLSDVVAADRRVVDLDDLEGEKRLLEIRGRLRGATEVVARLRRLQAAIDGRRWMRETRIASRGSTLLVCSDQDAKTLSMQGVEAIVLPNCYPGPDDQDVSALPDEPVVLMQGHLGYRPNAEGAAWFVNEVWPEVRSMCPSARLRLVGRATHEIEQLGQEPGVVVTGFVEDIGVELRNARVCVAPIRYGGGTRIKILESFAFSRPVVSTPAGAYGLDVSPGEEILLAGDPISFAREVVRLLRDRNLALKIATAGHGKWRRQYTREHFMRGVSRILE